MVAPANPETPDIEIVNNVYSSLTVSLDVISNTMAQQLQRQVQLVEAQGKQTEAYLLSQINNVVKLVESSNAKATAQLNATLDKTVALVTNNTEKILSSVIGNLAKIEKEISERELAQSLKSQLSLESLLRELIKSQVLQTNTLSNSIEDAIADLIQTVSTTDYIREDNLADWIKQAFQPLRIEWPSWAQQYDEQGLTLPFNPLQPFLDALNYLVDRVRDVKSSFDKLENGQYNTIDEFKNDIFGSSVAGSLGESAMFLLLIVPLFKEIIQAVYAKMFTELNFLALRKAQPARLNEEDAFNLFRRGMLTSGEMYEQLLDKGWSQDLIGKMFSASFTVPNMGDVFELYRRGEIERDVFNEALKRAGFDEYWTNQLEKLTRFIAPPQDVIRFMVRDAFNERIIQEGGTDIGWDNQKFLDEAAKSGIPPELARLYWISHWQLPSVNQGYEMFQREVISRDRLESLFVAADVAPNWREPLLALSYNLPTKVDVRRAYEDDIIDDDVLREYIRHVGTPPDWQERIFNWYKSRKLKLQAKKDNVKTFSTRDIIKAYNSGVMQQSEAVQRLVASGWSMQDAILLLQINVENELLRANEGFTTKLREQMRNAGIEGYRSRTLSKQESKDLLQQSGISEELALAMLSLVDAQYKIDRKVEIVSAVRKLYLGYEISEVKLFDTMLRNGFSQTEIDEHIRDLKPLRELRYKELARADIKKGTQIPELGIQWGIQRLRGLGYSDQTIKEIMLIEKWEDAQNSISINGDTLLS